MENMYDDKVSEEFVHIFPKQDFLTNEDMIICW